MYCLSGTKTPWLRRLDHLICEVPDIEEAVELFLGLGFPLAWPVGRFWPQGRTAGVALGRINLEFLQLDEGAPTEARIRTLAFEPVDLEAAAAKFTELGLDMRILEKWEPNPELLRLRGFDEAEAQTPQLICRNAYPPKNETSIDFFLCEYSSGLHTRLAQSSFPGLPPVTEVVLSTPHPASDWREIDRLFGLPIQNRGVEIVLNEEPSEHSEVVKIRSDRGPIDLGGFPARFQFS